MMVNELQEEKKMMEELVRSSMTPVSESTSPHPGNEADSVAPSQEVEASLASSQNPEETNSIPPKTSEEPVATEVDSKDTLATEAPVDAEAFFSQEASEKVKSD